MMELVAENIVRLFNDFHSYLTYYKQIKKSLICKKKFNKMYNFQIKSTERIDFNIGTPSGALIFFLKKSG